MNGSNAVSREQPWRIPPHWRWSKMGDVATVVGGSTPPTDRLDYFGGDIPWITPADLSNYTQKTISRGSRNITQAGLENSGARVLPAGSVLFSSRAPIGYVAIAANPVATNQGFKSFILREELRPDFVYYYLQHARELARSLASGTTFLEISGKKAAQIPIPVPPLDEQQCIVAEIEKQFTRLDAGVTSLKRMRTALKRYRASVLKAACEGRLVPTEAEIAREEDRRYETGEELLARIRQVKAEKIRTGEIRKPRVIDSSFLTRSNKPLPEGWALGRVEDFGSPEDNAIVDGPFGSNLKLSDYTPFGKYPVITITNIDEGFDLASLRKVSEEKFEEVKRSAVRAGDILVAKIGSSFGKTGIYPNDMPVGIIPANLLKVTPTVEMKWKYLFYHLRSLTFKRHLDTIVQYTAQPAFNVSKFKVLPVPIPPVAEQTRIVAEVDRKLSVVEELEALLSTELQRAIHLRQSILQQAFSGRA